MKKSDDMYRARGERRAGTKPVFTLPQFAELSRINVLPSIKNTLVQ